jgi:hypothetical protein
MARFMPKASCFRIRNSVNPDPTSMPPTAIGRTIENHTLNAIPLQYVAALTPSGIAGKFGPRK